ncbi:MAG: VCBS repeat-containing protein [Saprospiraceae bacterium]|nr:VCBS repeat-containing protein [Saprospiraceae bacterium]
MNFNISTWQFSLLLGGVLSCVFLFDLDLNLLDKDYALYRLNTESIPPISLPRFDRIVIDSNFKQGYQIKAADLNNDGLPDLMAVSTGMSEIFWYENPSWKKHILFDKTRDNIDLAPKDIDGDGDIDLALAARFNLGNSTAGGYVYWLENLGAGLSWQSHLIDSIPTSHRLRWADVDGDKVDELINLPIIGRGAVRPNYQQGVEFCYYEIPESPPGDPWRKIIIDTSLHMAHGLQLVQWPDSSNWSMLTASFEGVNLFATNIPDPEHSWTRIRLGGGQLGIRPGVGSSEIGLGKLGSLANHFLATIEPWHGDKVVLYQPDDQAKLWHRSVIDSSFIDGHALLTADLNHDGYDEIIAGHRGGDHSLYFYQFDRQNKEWNRYDLDRGGMSAAGLCLWDFNHDGLLDIAACGSATNNIVLYKNSGQP